MKFGNFESLRKNAKNLTKAVMFTAVGLGAGSVAGQDAKFQGDLKTGKLYEKMKNANVIDSTVISEEVFSKFTKEQMQEAVDKFTAATGRISPEQFEEQKIKALEKNPNSKFEIIDRVKYKLNTKEIAEEVQVKPEGSSYKAWYAKQKDGAVATWTVAEGGDGRSVKIDRDSKNKSLYASAPKVKSVPIIEDKNEAMASTSEDYVFVDDHFKNQNQK